MRTSFIDSRASRRLRLRSLWSLTARCRRCRPRAPTFWTVSTQADFLKGDVEDLSIDSDGRVFLGPSPALVAETAAPFLWTVLARPDGTLWAGIRQRRQGPAGRPRRQDVDVLRRRELEVHALAPAPDGGLYVATSPDGKIYQVAADGTSKTFFDPDDKYIWALAVDRTGNVFAATGDKGVIYKITPDGTGSRFLQDEHDQRRVAGVRQVRRPDRRHRIARPGLPARRAGQGVRAARLAVPRDSRAARRRRRHDLRRRVERRRRRDRPRRPSDSARVRPRAPVPTVSTEITAVGVVDNAPVIRRRRRSTTRPRHGGRGAIYRIRPDGFVGHALGDGRRWPYDLLIEPAAACSSAPATKARSSASPAIRRARRCSPAPPPGRSPRSCANPRDASSAPPATPESSFALGAEPAKRGTYESDVRDAGTMASWGVIRWRAAGKPGEVEISTRTGNTATPDETWSAWSKPYTNAGRRADRRARTRATSSGARSSTGDGDRLTVADVGDRRLPAAQPAAGVIVDHRASAGHGLPASVLDRRAGDCRLRGQHVRRPAAHSVSRHRASESAPSSPTPALGRRIYQKGLQTFVWKADDENDDRLQYDVLYRREGETAWKPLKRGLWDPIVVWDTTSVPDGTYFVKVAASDAPSNSPDTALVGELESVSFDIDNTPPVIELQPAVRAGNRDDRSRSSSATSSRRCSGWSTRSTRAAGAWSTRRTAFPIRGARSSRCRSTSGEPARSVIIRATDAMNNVATAVARDPIARESRGVDRVSTAHLALDRRVRDEPHEASRPPGPPPYLRGLEPAAARWRRVQSSTSRPSWSLLSTDSALTPDPRA